MKNSILYKYVLILLFTITYSPINAQVAIEKTSVNGNSTILDFPTSPSKGIILPIVETLPSGTSLKGGTFVMDKNDKKIKFFDGANWIDFSDTGSISSVIFNTSAEVGNGAIIGANSSDASGVLVLEATDKAVILPHVSQPEINIKSPYPGTMCYDTSTDSVAIFDGLKWNYWK